MNTNSVVKFAVFGSILALGTAHAQDVESPAGRQALVTKYCAGCHNDKLRSGGFSWSKIDLAQPELNAELTEKVIKMVRAA